VFLRFDGNLASDRFISIVILSYTRPKHLKNLVDSIHAHADMPFEIIISDDGSGPLHQDEILNGLHEHVSTLLFNTGVNMGIAASANRGAGVASSDYILVMNDDTLMTKPALRDIKRVLDVPYVGVFGPWFNRFDPSPRGEEELVHVRPQGFDLYLTSLPSGSSIFAFRKQIWQEVGGFPQVYHNGGDIAFIHKVCGSGYFNAQVPQSRQECFLNVDASEGYTDSTYTRSEFDSSYPRLFRAPNLREENLARATRVYNFSHEEYEKHLGLHNIESWRNYFKTAKRGDSYYWSQMQPFGQDEWQELVERDIVRKGES